ncbi:PAS domain S-box-containing protein/diguanylate cyclase (GGDEF) domain-containing protein [Actinokineospora alba]|uniref:PAS domain S-box-containing protein/diguanylate cyclase (GGDEF) domain-containing protein n=1 Tax=Actinokineospora alba TaxID=504798 RepID=A0A1H0TXL0_9PSEU|nr:EAL domain-containing protein [Actinokineospora alba]TDP70755.1 PAS domain S-box-containing protein/diguanylate cyclase (GGDEF)-like protein [Actinokineospora alba]SDJ15380.1 PAS domain S-box-containing protein/diguanylate cyclase (GGDEF) domain-containing protein [Actinokineospora alba]SDP58266.1 PAS domain S-box-containing protein/diguanylate cyclase (GGDEF) domain-containing protein [Actinokineospora alba]
MDRAELARRWAAALNQVVYVSRSRDDIESGLGELLARLAACVRPGADLAPAVEIGQELVASGFAKAGCIRATIDVLGPGLSEVEGVSPAEVIPALATVAAGFTAATRDRLFSEQEDIRHALVRAKENVERDLQVSEARFQDVFATSAVGMLISDLGGGVARANEALEEMLGYRKGTLFRKRLDDLFHPDEADFLRERYAELLAGECDTVRERTQFLRADGDTAWVRVAVTLLRDRDGKPDHHVTMVEDISDLHLIEHRLSTQGTRDMLTGLANRQAFEGRLEESMGSTADVSLFHIGLDDFGVVNNGIGRHAGDQLLSAIAGRLAMIAEEHDGALARIGGDEFALLTPGRHDVAALATDINDALAEPTYVDGEGVAVTASIAVLRSPRAGTEPAELLRATDITLRRLKSSGRRQWSLVEAEDLAARDRFRLTASIPGAWESGELDLDFRPVVELETGTTVAWQALLYWDSPVHGRLDHDRCRELLRDTGLSVPVDQWALGVACERTAQFVERLYVELTDEQAADQDLVGTVRRAGGLERLDLGVPVSALADPQAEDNVSVLIDLGVRIVLTGFGQTPGDVACLEDHPVHAVRLGHRVIERIGTAPDPKSMFVRSVLELLPMVRESGRDVLVPGVDTAEQADWWRRAGADRAVGAHFGEPDSLENVVA